MPRDEVRDGDRKIECEKRKTEGEREKRDKEKDRQRDNFLKAKLRPIKLVIIFYFFVLVKTFAQKSTLIVSFVLMKKPHLKEMLLRLRHVH